MINLQAAQTELEVVDEGAFFRVKGVPQFRTFSIARIENGEPVYIQASDQDLDTIIQNFNSDGEVYHGGTPPLMDRHRKHGDQLAAPPVVLGYIENPRRGWIRNKSFLFFDEVVAKDKWDLYLKKPFRSCEYDSKGFHIVGCAAITDVPQLNLGAVLSSNGKMYHCFTKEEEMDLNALEARIANLQKAVSDLKVAKDNEIANLQKVINESTVPLDIKNLQDQNAQLKTLIDAQNQHIANLESQHRKDVASKLINELKSEGYVINAEKALSKIANFSNEELAEFASDVRENYKKDVQPTMPRIPVDSGIPSGVQNFAGTLSAEMSAKCFEYARQNNVSFDQAKIKLFSKE